MTEPLTPEREQEIRESVLGEWYDGPWTQDYVDAEGDEPDYCRVVHHESGTVLATLPDFAGPIALFIADAHDAVPELIAELDRVRAELAARPPRAEVLAKAIGRLRAVPVQCTALTGPVWYGQGWADAITTLEEIAEYSVPDYEAYPGELVRLRSLDVHLRGLARTEDWERIGEVIRAHATSDREARGAVTEKASTTVPTAIPEPALTVHQERLLAHMGTATRTVWSTGPVEELYRTWHIRTPATKPAAT